MSNPPRLADIAKRTNTSVTTVSRVLAGGTSASRISPATRQRVLDAANALGYRPNLLARSLRTRRTQTIALLVSDISNPWFGQLALLIEQHLQRHGYWLMLCNSQEDMHTEQSYLRMLPQKGIDGLLLVPLLRSKHQLHEMIGETPVVVIDRPIEGIEAAVSSDEEQSVNLLAETLQRVGVRRIVLVAGPEELVSHKRRADLLSKQFEVVASHQGPAQPETGRRACNLLELGAFEAIVCTNNAIGQGVLECLPPSQNSPIVGTFDEIGMMNLMPVPLVCSMQDMNMIADHAVRLMLSKLGVEVEPVQGPVLLPTRVVANPAFHARAEA